MINHTSRDLFLSINQFLDIIDVRIDEFFKTYLTTIVMINLVKYFINKLRKYLFVKYVLLISTEHM